MKRIFLLLFFTVLLVGQAFAQIPDEQVLKLLKDAQKQGMDQQQIAMMLLQKGATKEQLLRMKNAYDQDGSLEKKSSLSKASENRMRGYNNVLSAKEAQRKKGVVQPLQDADPKNIFSGLALDSIGYEMDLNERLDKKMKEKEKTVFGREIFNNQKLTFEPNLNLPTPGNYVFGPGDEVIIDVWGGSEKTIRQQISPDGSIVVDRLGPIYLSGLTVNEANVRLKNAFAKIHATMGTSQPTTFIKLALGEIRSIQVNVMGEVVMPGTYTLPSLATLLHALYNAGGVNPIGTLRSVKLFRSGKEIVDFDVYEYILKGTCDKDILLREGDVIVVGPYLNLITLTGKVKRPMLYEMKNDETVNDLLNYAGGFTGDAYKKAIRLIRKSGREHQIYNVDTDNFNSFVLTDGDEISVDSVLSRFENKVEIKGALYRPGLYSIGEGVNTVKQLIDKAEGLKGDAFLNRAVLYRERPDLTIEVLAVDIAGLMTDKVPDIELKKNDVLYVPSIFDLKEDYTIDVKGEVQYPGNYKFVENMTLEDLVIQSGGLLESASTAKIDIARRIKEPGSTIVKSVIAENFTFTLKNGLIVDGNAAFVLKPFDEVYIRRSPGYQEQQNVFVEGEVLFGGEYALSQKGERLLALLNKAGGLTPEAYSRGARLIRKMTKDERMRVETLLKLTQQSGKDSIDINRLDIGDTYLVGIELDKALAAGPGSEYDVVLRDGDKLHIPEYTGTVKISGAVMYPNTAVYKTDVPLKYYIEQAGGFADRAKKRKAFIVYMNGTVARAKVGSSRIAPGCEIIVPVKQPKKGMSLAEVMSLASSTTSMAAMVTSILNLTK